MAAGDIMRRQDHQRTSAVAAPDFLLQGLKLGGEIGIARDQLLGEREIIVGLLFVVRQNETVTALHAVPDHQDVQPGQHEVSGFPIFLASARKHEIDRRHTVRAIGVERTSENIAPVRFDGVEERAAVDPFQVTEELGRRGGCRHAPPGVLGAFSSHGRYPTSRAIRRSRMGTAGAGGRGLIPSFRSARLAVFSSLINLSWSISVPLSNSTRASSAATFNSAAASAFATASGSVGFPIARR